MSRLPITNITEGRTKRYQLTRAKYLSPPEKELLCERLKKAPLIDYMVVHLLLATGARATEALNCRPCDIDHNQRAIEIIGLKGSFNRTIPLSDDFYTELVAYIDNNNIKPHEPIIAMSYRTLERHWQHFAPVGKPIKSTRHWFAMELYKRTKNIHLVKNALGHVNVSNTMIYSQYVYSMDELRDAILEG